MIDVVYYESATGLITGVKNIQEGMEESNCPAGSVWFATTEQVNPATQRVVVGTDGPEIFNRSEMPLSYGSLSLTTEDDLVITGIPAGATVTHPDLSLIHI